MQFSKIVGQEKLKQKLIQSVNENRVHHAQLFYGPEGSGSLALALAYATYLSCEERLESDSCGKCKSCIKYEKLVHPDLHFALPVATTRSVSKNNPVTDDFIAEWRTAFLDNPYIIPDEWYRHIGMEKKQGIINKSESESITHKLNLKTFESNFKIMVIWMPEKMNPTASNKLLKLVEEPPPMTVFLLVTEDPDGILPTIRSRTQFVMVPGIADEDLEKALARLPYKADEISNAVRLARGNYRKALEYLKENEESKIQLEWFIQFMRNAYSRNIPDIFAWVEELAVQGREKQKAFLGFALRMVRENLMLNMDRHELVRLTGSEMNFSRKFAPYIHKKNAPAIAEELNRASIHIEANAYARIVLLDLALNVVKLIR